MKATTLRRILQAARKLKWGLALNVKKSHSLCQEKICHYLQVISQKLTCTCIMRTFLANEKDKANHDDKVFRQKAANIGLIAAAAEWPHFACPWLA